MAQRVKQECACGAADIEICGGLFNRTASVFNCKMFERKAHLNMAQVAIDLQEGFTNDTAVIRLNGHGIYRHENKMTHHQIGLTERIVSIQNRFTWIEIEPSNKTR